MVINHQQLFEWLPIIKRAKVVYCFVFSKYSPDFRSIAPRLGAQRHKMQDEN